VLVDREYLCGVCTFVNPGWNGRNTLSINFIYRTDMSLEWISVLQENQPSVAMPAFVKECEV